MCHHSGVLSNATTVSSTLSQPFVPHFQTLSIYPSFLQSFRQYPFSTYNSTFTTAMEVPHAVTNADARILRIIECYKHNIKHSSTMCDCFSSPTHSLPSRIPYSLPDVSPSVSPSTHSLNHIETSLVQYSPFGTLSVSILSSDSVLSLSVPGVSDSAAGCLSFFIYNASSEEWVECTFCIPTSCPHGSKKPSYAMRGGPLDDALGFKREDRYHAGEHSDRDSSTNTIDRDMYHESNSMDKIVSSGIGVNLLSTIRGGRRREVSVKHETFKLQVQRVKKSMGGYNLLKPTGDCGKWLRTAISGSIIHVGGVWGCPKGIARGSECDSGANMNEKVVGGGFTQRPDWDDGNIAVDSRAMDSGENNASQDGQDFSSVTGGYSNGVESVAASDFQDDSTLRDDERIECAQMEKENYRSMEASTVKYAKTDSRGGLDKGSGEVPGKAAVTEGVEESRGCDGPLKLKRKETGQGQIKDDNEDEKKGERLIKESSKGWADRDSGYVRCHPKMSRAKPFRLFGEKMQALAKRTSEERKARREASQTVRRWFNARPMPDFARSCPPPREQWSKATRPSANQLK